MWRATLTIALTAASLVTACADDPPAPPEIDPADIPGVEYVYSAEEFVDDAYDQTALERFCFAYENQGDPEAAYEEFYAGSGELGGVEGDTAYPSTREVFDELVSRC